MGGVLLQIRIPKSPYLFSIIDFCLRICYRKTFNGQFERCGPVVEKGR